MPSIRFEKIPGRSFNNYSHCKLDGTIETLFPEFLSSNVKTYKNVEFDKIPGRNEHGCNLERRKVPKIGT